MNNKLLLFTLNCLTIFVSNTAYSATRTMTFAGVTSILTHHESTNNLAATVECTIVLVNGSSTDQSVKSVTFFGMKNEKTIKVGASSADLYRDDNTPLSVIPYRIMDPDTKIPSNKPSFILNPSSIYVFKFIQNTVSAHSHMGLCTGKIEVADTDPKKPGSVTAAGSIQTIQEARVLGGILSGAYYASGTHLFSSNNLAGGANTIPNLAPSSPPYPVGLSHNMNVYCANACASQPQQAATVVSLVGTPLGRFCVEQCGHFQGADPERPDGAGGPTRRVWTHNMIGFIAPHIPNPSFPIPVEMPNKYLPPTPPGPPNNVVTQLGLLRTTNGHYAGGMVVEMIMGPLTSICTANNQAWMKGATEHTHAGGVDDHAQILGPGNPGYPPERLVCNHRHAQPDLYMGVGDSAPFAINGAMPF
jgi:hypothetical protein